MSEINWTSNDFNNGQSSSGTNTANISGTDNSLRQAYTHGSLTKGLVAYYPMERGKGQIIRDAAQNNTGQIKGAKWVKDSKVGEYSLEFDGDEDDEVIVANRDKLNLTDKFTISFWMKPTDYWNDWHAVIDKRVGNSWEGYVIQWNSNNTLRLHSEITGDFNSTYSPTDNLNEWTHIVLRYDGSKYKFYIDGNEDTSTADDPLTAGSVPLLLSGSNYQYEPYWGELTDVRIYKRSLSAPEIKALYNLSGPNGVVLTEDGVPSQEDSGVSLWGFDDDQDTDTALDSWGGNDGSIEGAVYTDQRVYGSNALDFDDSGWVSTDEDFADLVLNGTITISAWVQVANHKNYNSVAATGYHSPSYPSARVMVDEDGAVWFTMGTNHDNEAHVGGISSIEEDTWNHLVLTADGEVMRGYINGKLVYSEEFDPAEDPPPNNFYIGTRPNDEGTRIMDGVIDEVKIYGEGLSAAEVEKLYNKGAYRINRSDTLQ